MSPQKRDWEFGGRVIYLPAAETAGRKAEQSIFDKHACGLQLPSLTPRSSRSLASRHLLGGLGTECRLRGHAELQAERLDHAEHGGELGVTAGA